MSRVPSGRLICVGSYTAEAGGHGVGLTAFEQDAQTGALRQLDEQILESPSFLAWHAQLSVVYAASELVHGRITAIRADDQGRLEIISQIGSGGAGPCHLTVTKDARHLLCAHYGS